MELNLNNLKSVINNLKEEPNLKGKFRTCDPIEFTHNTIMRKITFLEYDLENCINNYPIVDDTSLFGVIIKFITDPKSAAIAFACCFTVDLNGDHFYVVLYEKSLRNDPYFYNIIGHELGHIILGHLDIDQNKTFKLKLNKLQNVMANPKYEKQADMFSSFLNKERFNKYRICEPFKNHMEKVLKAFNMDNFIMKALYSKTSLLILFTLLR